MFISTANQADKQYKMIIIKPKVTFQVYSEFNEMKTKWIAVSLCRIP